jgi:hypothetical protein
MIAMPAGAGPEGLGASYETEIEELSLLLPSWQMEALAEAAQAEHLTVGQYLRRLLTRVLLRPAIPHH